MCRKEVRSVVVFLYFSWGRLTQDVLEESGGQRVRIQVLLKVSGLTIMGDHEGRGSVACFVGSRRILWKSLGFG